MPLPAASAAASAAASGRLLGASLPCPQFRPFVTEQVAQLIAASTATTQSTGAVQQEQQQLGSHLASRGRQQEWHSSAACASPVTPLLRESVLASLGAAARGTAHANTVGLSDDGGFGGAWVPLLCLPAFLRVLLHYLGSVWLFARVPPTLNAVFSAALLPREAGLLSQDSEQPALRFFCG